jgi:tetratricopeptide (TPR) repeat protein
VIPTLETVDVATEEVLDRIGGTDSVPARVPVVGPPGAGKSWLMSRLASLLEERKLVPIRAVAPDLDLDASIHLALQLAGDLRKGGANGALEPLLSVETPWEARCAAIKAAVGDIERSVILLDLPPSWSRTGTESSDPFTTRRWCTELIDALLDCARPFVLAVEQKGLARELLHGWAPPVELRPRSEGRALLAQREAWGQLAEDAKSVSDVLGDAAADKSPLELRILVALQALGLRAEKAREASTKGILGLVGLLLEAADRNEEFGRAWAVAALPRFSVDPHRMEDLLRDFAGTGDLAYRILRDALLIPDLEAGGLTLHPILRNRAPLHLVGDLQSAHARLADAFAANLSDLVDRVSALCRLETAYHAARARRADLVHRVAADQWQVCVLAREISLAGDLEKALEIYRSLLDRFPKNTYAREYVAFHLERLGRDLDTAEQNFRRAADEELGHPWWARRFVEALVRRGRIADAIDEWRRRTATFLDDLEDESRATHLAKNYHFGIARRFLSRGALRETREVLEAVPEAIRDRDDELRSIWNDLLLTEEAEQLGGSVFPRTVRFETRWSRPHVREEIADRRSFSAWYPGKIDEIGDDEIRVLLGHRVNGHAELFHSTVSLQQFQDAARVKVPEDVEEGQFLEVYMLDAGTARERSEIALYPRPQRGGIRLLLGTLGTPLDDFDA